MRRLLTALRHRLACACGQHRDELHVIVELPWFSHVPPGLLSIATLYWQCTVCRRAQLLGTTRAGSNRRVRA